MNIAGSRNLGAAALLALAAAMPRFGDIVEPKEFDRTEIRGTHKSRKPKTKNRKKAIKMHRRRYLCGKPGFRSL